MRKNRGRGRNARGSSRTKRQSRASRSEIVAARQWAAADAYFAALARYLPRERRLRQPDGTNVRYTELPTDLLSRDSIPATVRQAKRREALFLRNACERARDVVHNQGLYAKELVAAADEGKRLRELFRFVARYGIGGTIADASRVWQRIAVDRDATKRERDRADAALAAIAEGLTTKGTPGRVAGPARLSAKAVEHHAEYLRYAQGERGREGLDGLGLSPKQIPHALELKERMEQQGERPSTIAFALLALETGLPRSSLQRRHLPRARETQ